MRSRVFVCQAALAVVMLGVVVLPSAPANDNTGGKRPPPASIQEAKERLEETLGRFDEQDQWEWQFIEDIEHRYRVKPDDPEVLVRIANRKVVSHPFAGPESVSFDQVSQWKREVFDVGQDGDPTLTRTQVSHNLERFTLTVNSGVWLATGTYLSNGVHSAIGRSSFQGTVKWHDDGFELIGASSVGSFYAPGGEFILGTGYGSTRYRRDGNTLIVQYDTRSYHLARDPDGELTQFPDFARPFGTPYAKEFRSEPRTANER